MLQRDDLVQLLGVQLGSPEIERLREELDPALRVEQDDDAFFLAFPVRGLELLFSREGVLQVVFLFADREEGAQQWRTAMAHSNIEGPSRRVSTSQWIEKAYGENSESLKNLEAVRFFSTRKSSLGINSTGAAGVFTFATQVCFGRSGV